MRLARPGQPARAELLWLLALIAIAALTRLPGLDVRGPFDADQGKDMLVLSALLRGEIPLLGPQTSIGTFHHGAVYYYLLAPAVVVLGADPVAVTGWIALFGIAAVAATWWLARLVGGPIAAAAAGLLAAVSPAGIDESTFIWNPNLIPVAAALAFAGAIHAWQTRSPRWWLLAATGAMVTMQCHVLGVVVLPPLLVAFALDVRRRRREGTTIRPILLAGIGGAAIIAAGYVPLLVHELSHDFSETRAILAYITGGGRSSGSGILERTLLVGLRSITWPLTGVVTARPVVSLLVGAGVIALIAAATVGPAPHRRAARWLVATLAWSVVALAVFAPSLAVVTPGLPNDHYHAYLDPIVLALVGAGVARIAGLRVGTASAGPARHAGRVAAGALVAVLVAVSITAWPPAVSPDGGWRSAEAAAAEIERLAAGTPYALVGIPEFKSTNAVRFPLERLGADPPGPEAVGPNGPPLVVFVCDPLFAEVVGAPCGGPAEDAWLAARGLSLQRLGAADGGPRRVLSAYGPSP